MLSVSLDGQDTGQMLLDLIRDEHISYPVLHAGAVDGWNDGNFGWTIHGVPSAYIIDPQGNIFADVYPQADLIEVFDWLRAQDRPLPPVGMAASYTKQDGELVLNVQLSSPTHAPLDVKVSVTKYKLVYNPEYDTDGTGEPNDYEQTDMTADLNLDFTAEFGEFGDMARQVVIPTEDDATLYSYSIEVGIPGMEQLNDGEGFSVSTYGYVRMEEPEEEEAGE